MDPRRDTAASRRDIQKLMLRFSRSVEVKSIAEVIAVAPSLTPEQQQEWERLFGRAPTLRFDIAVQKIQYEERGAEADLRGFLAYTPRGTTRRVVDPWNMTADLALGPDGWRIIRLH